MKNLTFSLSFSVFLLILFLLMVYQALDFQILARYFPLTIASLAALLMVLEIILQFKNKNHSEKNEEFNIHSLRYLVWIVGYMLLIFVIGFIFSTIVFLASFFIFETKYSILKTAVTVVIVIVVILFLQYLLNLRWPTGLLF